MSTVAESGPGDLHDSCPRTTTSTLRPEQPVKLEGAKLAGPKYQYEKRQKDLAKKKKQEEKRQRKAARKEPGVQGEDQAPTPGEGESAS
jgi:hypothetical protein